MALASDVSKYPKEGLIVQMANSHDRIVMSRDEIADDVLATMSKLKAAANRDTLGRRWKQRRRKNGVDMFELVPGGGDDPDDDLDVAHAMVAKTELRCHLNEVLNVLINQKSSDYEASMQALCGSKFKQGRILFSQRRKLREHTIVHGNACEDGLVGVQLATLGPNLKVKLQTKRKRTQKLCFSSYTHQSMSKDRAFHLIKTIPKEAHDLIIPTQDRSALRREIDHIAAGFEIESQHGGYGAITHTTRIFLHTYASNVSPSHYGRSSRQPGVEHNSTELARHREAIMNPEARHVMDLLTKSLREIEAVIRRRRFGFQTFVYFPTMYDSEATKSYCSICCKNFSLFRRDFFCQLCGNMVCGDCSKLYDVEARIGVVRKNRCCVHCVVRVDACVFDDEDLIPALSPVIVDVDEGAWDEKDLMASDNDDTISVASDHSSVTDNLYSPNPMARAQALEMLAQLVQKDKKPSKLVRTTSASRLPKAATKEKKKQVMRDIDELLSETLRSNRSRYTNPEALVVCTDERDYILDFSYEGNKNVPLAPVPETPKEAKRLSIINESGVLKEKYDRSALDMLAQVAAKKLNCSLGFVSVIGEKTLHAIGSHNLPEEARVLPRDETLCMHGTYAEKPLIVKNPQRDMRFAHMGAVKDFGLKFYAGFPVRAPDGSVVASLCVGDSVAHKSISTKEYATMEALTKLAADLIVPKSPIRHRDLSKGRSKSDAPHPLPQEPSFQRQTVHRRRSNAPPRKQHVPY